MMWILPFERGSLHEETQDGRLAALLALVLMLWAVPVSAQGAIGEAAAAEMSAVVGAKEQTNHP